MTTKMEADPRIDPRLKAAMGSFPTAPRPDAESREQLLAEVSTPEARAAADAMKAGMDLIDSEEIAPSTGLVTYPRSEGRFAGVCIVPAGRSAARRDAPVCVSASRGAVPHQTPKTPPTAETCLLTQCPAAVAHSTDETSNQETIKRSTLAILSTGLRDAI